MTRAFSLFAAVFLAVAPAFAWNATGHKTVAAIAWRHLSPATQERIVTALRRHPTYDRDFAQKMPAISEEGEGEWLAGQAACWPDIIRKQKEWDHPTWHYVDFPIFIGPERPVTFNRATVIAGPQKNWNVLQAVAYCRKVIAEKRPIQQQALAYCWLFHLAGDLHQPLHSTALVCDRFPEGDRGGNLIKTRQGGNLHSLWDGLLGKDDRPANITKLSMELRGNWVLGDKIDPAAWVQESHAVCKASVYSPEILAAVASGGDDAPPINLPESYLKAAGAVARKRVLFAGMRLALLLEEKPTAKAAPADKDLGDEYDFAPPPPPRALSPVPVASLVPAPAAAPAQGYWLNTPTGQRHNSGCRWYGKTKHGRYCGPDEGDPCGQCGG